MDPFVTPAEEKEKKKIKQKIFSLLALVFVLLIGSTMIYSHLEGWDFVDALYFSTLMMTKSGSADMAITTDAAKLFTVLFLLIGVTIILYTLSILGTYYVRFLDYHQPVIRENIKNTVKKLYTGKKQEDKWVDIYRIKKKP